MATAANISKKRKHVAEGVFRAELDGFLRKELAEDGYSGVEVRITPKRTEIIILATRTQNVLGDKAKRIRELTAVVQKRFQMKDGQVELFAEKVANRGLCAIAQEHIDKNSWAGTFGMTSKIFIAISKCS